MGVKKVRKRARKLEEWLATQEWKIPAFASRRGSRMCSPRSGRPAPRDVKNEGRPGYVYENTVEADKMAGNQSVFWPKKHGFRDNWGEF
jgi:hypothetical protein